MEFYQPKFYKVNGISIELSHKPIRLLFHKTLIFCIFRIDYFFQQQNIGQFSSLHYGYFNLHFNPELLQKLIMVSNFFDIQSSLYFCQILHAPFEHKWHICNIAYFSHLINSWLNSACAIETLIAYFSTL